MKTRASREYKRERKRIWQDVTGCSCTLTIQVNGKQVMLDADEICTKDAIRCNTRYNRWLQDKRALDEKYPEAKPKRGAA